MSSIARRAPAAPGVVVLGFEPADPGPYGRLIVDGNGALEAIVEARDATPEQLAVGLCNSGVMVIDLASRENTPPPLEIKEVS